MTRRVVKPGRSQKWLTQKTISNVLRWEHRKDGWWGMAIGGAERFVHCGVEIDGGHIGSVLCPYGQPGDRLWVRERARVIDWRGFRQCRLRYEADGFESGWLDFPGRLKGNEAALKGRCVANGVFREGTRLTLEVTEVRVERLQDISEEDVRAEGMRELPLQEGQPGAWWHDGSSSMHSRTARGAFCSLWASINGPESWDANSWVWVVGFKRAAAAEVAA